MRFFCPGCWQDFAEDVAVCPQCGLDIRAFWDGKDYVEHLIVALGHREPATAVRAAWLLGRLGDERAVEPLLTTAFRATDPYLARQAVRALAAVGTPAALAALEALANHPMRTVRELARRLASDGGAHTPAGGEKSGR